MFFEWWMILIVWAVGYLWGVYQYNQGLQFGSQVAYTAIYRFVYKLSEGKVIVLTPQGTITSGEPGKAVDYQTLEPVDSKD